MLRRAVILWGITISVIPVLFALSASGLGIQYSQEEITDSRLPTVAGCFGRQNNGSDNSWDRERCTFGVQNSRNVLLIVGDSTVASMTDGIVAAAAGLDVAIVAFPSRGCSFTSRAPHSYEWCVDYFQESINLAMEISPVGVIISNYLSRMDLNDRRIPLADGKLPDSRQQRLDSTVQALNEAIWSLRRISQNLPILIVHEVPTIPFRRPSILLDRSDSPSLNKESRAFLRQQDYILAVEELMKSYTNIAAINPETVFCNDSQCSSVTLSGAPLYMDSYHLNPRGSMLLTGQFKKWIVDELLES